MTTQTTFDSYQAFCRSTLPAERTPVGDLVHGLTGLVTETGEIADPIKRLVAFGKPIDFVNIKEEVGDVLWYLSLIADCGNFSLADAAAANIRKLEVRREKGFANTQGRDLEAERQALVG